MNTLPIVTLAIALAISTATAATKSSKGQIDALEEEANEALYYGHHDEAAAIFTRIIKLEHDPFRVTHFLSNRAACYGNIGRNVDSEKDLRTAMSKLNPSMEGYDERRALLLNNLGEALLRQDRDSDAEPIFQQALSIRRRLKSELDCAYSLVSLGACSINLSAYDNAVAFLEEALSIFERLAEADGIDSTFFGRMWFSGVTAPQSVECMKKLRRALIAADRKKDAIQLSARYLDAFKKFKEMDESHPQWVKALGRHADTLKMVGEDKEATELYSEVIVRCVKNDAPLAATDAMLSVADILIRQDNFADAELFLQKLQKFNEDAGHDADVADDIQSRRVDIAMRKKDFPNAVALLQEREKYLKSLHNLPARAWQTFLERSIVASAMCGNTKDVEKRVDNYLRLKTASLDNLLRWTSEKERLAYVERGSPLSVACNFGRPTDIATALLQWKSIVLRSTAEDRHFRATAVARGQSELVTKLATAKAAANELSLRVGVTPGADDARVLQRANLEVEQLEKQLIGTEKQDLVRNCLAEDWTSVRKHIPENSAFLDFVRFDCLGADEGQSRYGVAVLRQKAEPVWVNLGNASQINGVVKRLHSAIINKAGNRDQQVSDALQTLFGLLLAPVEQYISDARTLYICPDDVLFQVPFAALRDHDHRVAIQRWNIVGVSHASAFLAAQPMVAQSSPLTAIVLGGPSYTYREHSFESAVPATQVDSQTSTVVQVRGHLRDWDDLPGALAEATAVEKILKSKGYTVQLGITDHDEASESWLRSQRGFKIIHVASHAFALGPTQQNTAQDSLERIAETNVMMASGFALRGGQSSRELWRQNKIPPPASDGILFAAEIAELNWGDVDLAFLSCCDSGLGVPRAGEGLFGLQRALEMAGVRHAIVTLWRQNDDSPLLANMVTEFYLNLKGAANISDAFNEAQRHLLTQAGSSAHGFTDWADNVAVFWLNESQVATR